MLDPTALRQMNVLFATPCYISNVTMNYVVSLWNLFNANQQAGLSSNLHMHSESLVTRARNEMVAFFLANETYTHLFWIDSDIAFDPAMVHRLLLADRDIACGIYPLKRYNWPAGGLPAQTTRCDFEARYTDYPFNPVNFGQGPIAPYIDADRFIEVAEAPTGFMVIKRQVFLDLIKHYPELAYVPDGKGLWPKETYWLFFDCFHDKQNGRYLSEDYAFCRRWRDMGGKVYADLDSRLLHLGQHLFPGDLSASIAAREG